MSTYSRDDHKQANATLCKRGWVKVCSVMHSDNKGTEYGSHYMKDGASFWLNKDTFQALPA